jgi:FixJ family two-component response regulator
MKEVRFDRSAPTVFVVDETSATLDRVQRLVESAGLRARTFRSGESFLRGYDPHAAGCAVVALDLPGMSGLEVQERLLSIGAPLPLIFLSAQSDIATIVRTMKAGAADVVLQPFDAADLLARIRQAVEQDAVLRRDKPSRVEACLRLARLTARERQVFDAVVRGEPSRVIAVRLGIKLKTVEAHRANLLRKTGARSVAELVQLAMATTPAERCV